MNISDLVQPRHLSRRAVIYVRQSSPQQVLSNQESLRLQYALVQRATQLGWREHDIEVVDADLGQTAASMDGRVGFQRLVTQVALGEIGILIAYDATRLARNCSHWYQLLDLCGRTNCLIADRDGLYDPTSINGRLLLGLKGQISELELHTIRARLTAGIVSKAQRGELELRLPVGLVRHPTGQVLKHPDLEVQGRIALIFDMILQKKSISQLVLHLCRHGLKVPRRDRFGDIRWQRPTTANIGSIVKNPAYAGAFVYGRSKTTKSENTGKNQQKPLPPEQWKICIHDKYPAYVGWETFERIRTMLRDNRFDYDRTRGVPREGKALLQGIAYCGECGHKMFVRYKGGTRYVCHYLRQHQGEPVCQCLPADPVHSQVLHWFFEALSVAEIDLAAGALAQADQRRDEFLSAGRQQVERLRYQARLTERQYQHADPENRLVASELERRWEEALRELKDAEETLAQQDQRASSWAIPADLLDAIKDLGPRLPELWEQNLFSTSQRKSILRSLIDKVVLHRVAPDKVRTRVVWRGGATTSTDVTIAVGSLARLSRGREFEAAILRLARNGQTDKQVAHWLTSDGHRSPTRDIVLPSTVKYIRLRHRVMHQPNQSRPVRVEGYLTLPQLASRLGVPRHWIHHRISTGAIRVQKDTHTNCYLFPDKMELLRRFRQLVAAEVSEVRC